MSPIDRAREALAADLMLNSREGLGSAPRALAWLRREHSAGRVVSSLTYPAGGEPVAWFWRNSASLFGA